MKIILNFSIVMYVAPTQHLPFPPSLTLLIRKTVMTNQVVRQIFKSMSNSK